MEPSIFMYIYEEKHTNNNKLYLSYCYYLQHIFDAI